MPLIHQRRYSSHFHKVKRLHHPPQHGEHMTISKLPRNIIPQEFLHRTSKYIKFFDYPLAQLLADHSSNPLQNLTRQQGDLSSNIPVEGRFVNHEMIIRRNGETTILRPRQDLVLVNGFTPIRRPSSRLPAYSSSISHVQVPSSVSIMTKMSVKKCEQTSVIKSKRRDPQWRKRCNEVFSKQINLPDYPLANQLEQRHPQQSDLIHLIEQALYEIIGQQTPLPPPLMSVLPQFHNPPNQSCPPSFEEASFNWKNIPPVYSNDQSLIPSFPTFESSQSFSNSPREQYHSFGPNHQSYSHSPIFSQRNAADFFPCN